MSAPTGLDGVHISLVNGNFDDAPACPSLDTAGVTSGAAPAGWTRTGATLVGQGHMPQLLFQDPVSGPCLAGQRRESACGCCSSSQVL